MIDITNDALKRRDGETDLEYHRRLVFGKLVDKTLADYDYQELSKYVYDKEYAPDVARRLMYGSRYTLSLLEDERVKNACCSGDTSAESVMDDLNDKLLEIEKERRRLFDQRRELNKVIRSEGRAEYLYERLADAADKLGETVGNVFAGGEALLRNGDNEAIIVFSDWHYGMTTNNIFNRYDTSICRNRVRYVVEMAKRRIINNGCRKLHIVVLGDMFHGAIHTSARVASEELVCDQLMQVSEILAQAITELSSAVDETKVYMTYGNHCRTVQNKNDNLHRDNMERIIPWWLRERVSGIRGVEIVEESPNEFLYLEVAGHGVCAAHGDLDFVKSSPRLIATLFQKTQGKDVEYIILGDKHHREGFDEIGIDAWVSGSLCGTDEYANGKRLYSMPSQLLLIFNKDIGLDAEYRIVCRDSFESEHCEEA